MMAVESLTLHELEVMDHATAWSRGKRSRLTRNRFCASEGHPSWDALQSLCTRGFMCMFRRRSDMTGGDDLFMVTEAGLETLKRWRP